MVQFFEFPPELFRALRLSIIANPRKSFTGPELLFGADSQIRTDDLLIIYDYSRYFFSLAFAHVKDVLER